MSLRTNRPEWRESIFGDQWELTDTGPFEVVIERRGRTLRWSVIDNEVDPVESGVVGAGSVQTPNVVAFEDLLYIAKAHAFESFRQAAVGRLKVEPHVPPHELREHGLPIGASGVKWFDGDYECSDHLLETIGPFSPNFGTLQIAVPPKCAICDGRRHVGG